MSCTKQALYLPDEGDYLDVIDQDNARLDEEEAMYYFLHPLSPRNLPIINTDPGDEQPEK